MFKLGQLRLLSVVFVLTSCSTFKDALNKSPYFQPGLILEKNETPDQGQALAYFRLKYFTIIDGNRSERDFREFYTKSMRNAGAPYDPDVSLPVTVPAGKKTDLPISQDYLIRFLPQQNRKAAIQGPTASMSFDLPKNGITAAGAPFKATPGVRFVQSRVGDFVINESIQTMKLEKIIPFTIRTVGVPGKITNFGSMVIVDDRDNDEIKCILETEGSGEALTAYLANQYPWLKEIPTVTEEAKCE
ncbi:MAG: hypothetical protein K8S54_13970 [Spirochaetia bacterium]|nr:hypothetical protein [Spirochaetia bacterium]